MQTGVAKRTECADLVSLLTDHAAHCRQTYKRRNQDEKQREDIADGAHLIDRGMIGCRSVMALAVKHGPAALCHRINLRFGIIKGSLCVIQLFKRFTLRLFQLFIALFQCGQRVAQPAPVFFDFSLPFGNLSSAFFKQHIRCRL